ncbi:phage tail assembly chaperone G [Solibacillus cecembensis]|uniref:phage tail assembly chaperone G n=1 Tax=Solibacillus cecembensis TaxID=459347 RepID=UPI003CFE3566
MQITLKIEGNDKTFVNDFVSARLLRDALKLNEDTAQKKEEGTYTATQQLDDLAEIVVKAFNHQFTLDQLWDSTALEDFQGELMRVFNKILGLGGYALNGAENEGK